ncbi:MAG TPA: DUF6644 family protein [Caulobacteraceae bacterium]|nr:DUF6644 family protein [Caulobacteraceae bacterium]
MSLTSFLEGLQNSGVATGIRNSLYIFPTLEAVHVIALGLVFGTIMIVDLRLLGVAGTQRSYTRISSDCLKWTWAAFGLAVLTGSFMFITNARVYVDNGFFRTKFVLMALAGLNMLVFQLTVAPRHGEWSEAKVGPLRARIAASLSLLLWLSVIFMGRSVGFTTTGAAAKLSAPPAGVDFNSFLSASSSPSAPPSSSAAP